VYDPVTTVGALLGIFINGNPARGARNLVSRFVVYTHRVIAGIVVQ
jgi:hypothetical protein